MSKIPFLLVVYLCFPWLSMESFQKQASSKCWGQVFPPVPAVIFFGMKQVELSSTIFFCWERFSLSASTYLQSVLAWSCTGSNPASLLSESSSVCLDFGSWCSADKNESNTGWGLSSSKFLWWADVVVAFFAANKESVLLVRASPLHPISYSSIMSHLCYTRRRCWKNEGNVLLWSENKKLFLLPCIQNSNWKTVIFGTIGKNSLLTVQLYCGSWKHHLKYNCNFTDSPSPSK